MTTENNEQTVDQAKASALASDANLKTGVERAERSDARETPCANCSGALMFTRTGVREMTQSRNDKC